MSSTLESALIEAVNPSTSPKRLRELSLRKRKNERDQLRPVIAANPNVDDDLHLQLAAEEAGPHCFSPSALLCGRVRASYRAHAKQIWPLRRASNVLICAPLLLSLRFV